LHKTLPQGYPVRRSERRGFGEGLGSDRFAASTLTLTLDEAARMRPQKLVPPKFNAELCLCRLEVGGWRSSGCRDKRATPLNQVICHDATSGREVKIENEKNDSMAKKLFTFSAKFQLFLYLSSP